MSRIVSISTVILKISITLFIMVGSSWNKVSAQWSNDPAANLTICSQGYPHTSHIVYSDNHYYVTYFKFFNQSNCLFLQVLDFNGKRTFDGDGLLVSGFPHTATSLSKLIVDLKGNAIIAFCDNRNGEYSDISLYKMDLAGNQLWGKDGLCFCIPNADDAGPIMAVNPDNSITLGFNSTNRTVDNPKMQAYLYRISESGTVMWNAQPRILTDEVYHLHPVGIKSLNDGSVLLAYTKAIFDGPGFQIMVKKIDVNGQDVWKEDVLVAEECLSISSFVTTFLQMENMLYLAWQANGCIFGVSYGYIQGISSNGDLLWPAPGVKITEGDGHEVQNPSIQGFDSNGNALVLWYNTESFSNYQYLYGQLISPAGELKWGINGLEIKARVGTTYSYASMVNDTAIVVYSDPAFTLDMYKAVKAMAVKMDGSFCWPQEAVLNNCMTPKYMDGFTPIINGQGVLVFAEGIQSNFDKILIQNIWTDGTIGLKSNSAPYIDTRSDIRIYSSRDRAVYIEGLTGLYDIQVYNTLGQCLFQRKQADAGNQSVRIEVPQLNPGIYIVKIMQKGGKLTCSKVLFD